VKDGEIKATTILSPGINDDQRDPNPIDEYLISNNDTTSDYTNSMNDVGSVLDEGEDMYTRSILLSTEIKEPEDLIDNDLWNMMKFIKKLKQPTEAEIKSKSLELGELLRHKTLIFDLDETLINSQLLSKNESDQRNSNFDFIISLPSGS
jgi:hypothetical protein